MGDKSTVLHPCTLPPPPPAPSTADAGQRPPFHCPLRQRLYEPPVRDRCPTARGGRTLPPSKTIPARPSRCSSRPATRCRPTPRPGRCSSRACEAAGLGRNARSMMTQTCIVQPKMPCTGTSSGLCLFIVLLHQPWNMWESGRTQHWRPPWRRVLQQRPCVLRHTDDRSHRMARHG